MAESWSSNSLSDKLVYFQVILANPLLIAALLVFCWMPLRKFPTESSSNRVQSDELKIFYSASAKFLISA